MGAGEYPVLIGASSRDIRLSGAVIITGQKEVSGQYGDEVVRSYRRIGSGYITPAVFQATIGRAMPPEPSLRPFTMETPVKDFQTTWWGRMLYRGILKIIEKEGQPIAEMPDSPEKEALLRAQKFTMAFIPGTSPRSMVQSGGGRIQMNVGRAMPLIANGQLLPALRMILRKETRIPLPCETEEK